MRHSQVVLTYVLLISFLVISPTPSTATTTFWTCPDGTEGQTLHVLNWTTFIGEDTIANFEALCDVTIVYETFGTTEELLALLEANPAGYDVIFPIDSAVYSLIAEGQLRRLNPDLLTNRSHITPEMQSTAYDPQAQYTMPFQWDTIGLGYNQSITGPLTSWSEVFSYPGKVAWLDDARTMLGTALLMLGLDPNTTNQADLQAAGQYLIDHSSNLAFISPDDGQDRLTEGAVDIAIEYNGDIFQVINDCKCQDYQYLIPQEGAIREINVMAIPLKAPNPTLANIFINYIMDPQVAANISNYTAYATTNATAIDQGLIYQYYLENDSIYPSQETIERLYDLTSNPQMAQQYQDVWDNVKLQLGR